ncbi:hypothetical protein AAVH_13173 [Aphelenchoides avenae]|nr:hypothetical protein AAVH_13173 [Aphelenchus avenae]
MIKLAESNHSESENGSTSTNETYHSSLFFLLPINAISWAIIAALAFARPYMYEELAYHLIINAHAVTAFTSAVNFYVLYFTSAAYKAEFFLQMRIVGLKIFWCKSLKVDPYLVTPPELANLKPWEYNLQKTGWFDAGPIFVRPGPADTAEVV